MRIVQGLLFLFFGAGLLWIAWRSLQGGPLPWGARGLSGRLEFRRAEQPLRYWLALAVYAIAGVALVLFALGVLAGDVQPLPLR